MKMLKIIGTLIKDTFVAFQQDNASRLAAALAYYAVFAIAPLLIIVIAVVGFVFGERAAANEIATQLEATVGPEAASLIESAISNVSQPGSGMLASVVGAALLLFGASNLFAALQDTLNMIWHAPPKEGGGILGIVVQRLTLFAMVLLIGGLFLLSQLTSIVVAAVSAQLDLGGLVQFINLAIAFGVLVLLFALIYKILPDLDLAWRDVLVGGLVTSVLFSIGRYALSWYLGSNNVGSVYGVAGSLVILLVWINYSAQVFLLGAEFTWVYAKRYGSQREADTPPSLVATAALRAAAQRPQPVSANRNGLAYAMTFVGFLLGLFVSRLRR